MGYNRVAETQRGELHFAPEQLQLLQTLLLNRRTVVFAANLPPDGQETGDLADAVFSHAAVSVAASL